MARAHPQAPTARAPRTALPWNESRDSLLQTQAVEEVASDRQLATHRLDIALATESTHRDLKRMRPARGRESNRLTVEDDLARRQRAHRLDDLRHGSSHFVQRARVDANFVASLVHLDARAIHLPFECNRAFQLFERFRHIRSGLREHRDDW